MPEIETLDNFYAKQHGDGEICREINRATGKDYAQWVNHKAKDLHSLDPFNWGSRFDVKYVGRDVPKPAPQLTLDALNHPIFAWAELESVHITGDRSRLADHEPLCTGFDWKPVYTSPATDRASLWFINPSLNITAH